MTTKAQQDIRLAEQLMDAAIDGHEVYVPEGLYICHFEAVAASRGRVPVVSRGEGLSGAEWCFQHKGKFGKLIWK